MSYDKREFSEIFVLLGGSMNFRPEGLPKRIHFHFQGSGLVNTKLRINEGVMFV